jgi:hypothetical protein
VAAAGEFLKKLMQPTSVAVILDRLFDEKSLPNVRSILFFSFPFRF